MTKRLNDDLLRERGKLVRDLAERVRRRWEGGETPGPVRLLRGHRLPLTCSALSDDDAMAVSGAKDGTVIRWDVETGGKVVTLKTEENRALGNQVSFNEEERMRKRRKKGKRKRKTDSNPRSECAAQCAWNTELSQHT